MTHSCTLALLVLLHPSGQSTRRHIYWDKPRASKTRAGKVRLKPVYHFSLYSCLPFVRAGAQIEILTTCRKFIKQTSSPSLFTSTNTGVSRGLKSFRHLPSPLYGSLFHLLVVLWGRPEVSTSFQACWRQVTVSGSLLHHCISGQDHFVLRYTSMQSRQKQFFTHVSQTRSRKLGTDFCAHFLFPPKPTWYKCFWGGLIFILFFFLRKHFIIL